MVKKILIDALCIYNKTMERISRKNDVFGFLLIRMWQGFLGSTLASGDLVLFAFYMFIIAPNNLRKGLINHLVSDPTGATMIKTYLKV